MIDTKELRQLAQAALIGPDGVSLNWLKLLQDFQKEASPAVIDELLDRLELAEKERDALRTLVVMRCDLDYLPQFTQGHESHEFTEPITAEHCRWFVAEIERLRTDCDALRAALRHEADCVEAAKAEIEALRAKIAEMERQEIGFRERCTPSSPTKYNNRFPLYALPGAKGE